ncbi:MAG: MerR family transcriptional regulator [bacterium]|nr:MerR family transcriptional regulator [bacterium]
MPVLRIGEVEKRSGIAASAIRYYENEGLLPPPERRSGRRVYDESILARLSLIELAKHAGFSIAEIARLVAGFGRRTPPGELWRRLAKRKLTEIEARIAEAEQMKAVLETVIACRCPTVEDCVEAFEARP